MMHKKLLAPLVALITASAAFATPFTETSPTANGLVPAGISAVGGIVFDARGLNNAELTAQRAATGLFAGTTNAGNNPLTIGTQTGLTPALLGQLGGGFSELAIRITLLDGDTAAGNFDYNNNFLYLNNILVGNFSTVTTQQTNAAGTVAGTSGVGFRNGLLDTGWFHVTNATTLASIYSSILGTGVANYQFFDTDPGDNVLNFTQGVSSSLINVELPPVVVSAPDSGATFGLLALSGFGLLLARRRRNA